MPRHNLCTFVVALLTLALAPSLATAGEIDLTGSLGAGASNRDDDAVGNAAIRGRYAVHPMFAVSLAFVGGAGQNDERTIGGIVAAGEVRKILGRFQPAFRLGIVHQHETARADAEENPITVTLGVDEAIRHRTGAAAELGTTVDIARFSRSALFGAADLSAQLMFDDNGPRSYLLLSIGVGYRFGR